MHQAGHVRVLVADDHLVVREGMVTLLSRANGIEVVGEAANGLEAVALHCALRPDVTLMDLRMPALDGTGAIKRIREQDPNARILVLTALGGEDDIYAAVRAGAKGYLYKDTSCAELMNAVRMVNEGTAYFPDGVIGKLTQRMAMPNLTVREMDVIMCMAAGKSNQEIAQTLYISEGTVKSHINRLLSKLNVSDRTQAVTLALKRGLVQLS